MSGLLRITESDVLGYQFSHQIAAQFGKGQHRELRSVVQGNSVWFEVWNHGIRVLGTYSIHDAVEEFNEAAYSEEILMSRNNEIDDKTRAQVLREESHRDGNFAYSKETRDELESRADELDRPAHTTLRSAEEFTHPELEEIDHILWDGPGCTLGYRELKSIARKVLEIAKRSTS